MGILTVLLRRRFVLLLTVALSFVGLFWIRPKRYSSLNADDAAKEIPLETLAWNNVVWKEIITPKIEKENLVTIVSVGDLEPVLVDNRAAYARRHGLEYVHCGCDLQFKDITSKGRFEHILNENPVIGESKICPPMNTGKWQVYMCLLTLWKRPGSPKWALYIDNDAMFLDMDRPPSSILSQLADTETSLIFSAEDLADRPDKKHAFNAGVFLARSSNFTRDVFEKLLIKRKMFRDPNYGFKDTLVWYGVLEEAQGVVIQEIKKAAMKRRLHIFFRHVTVANPYSFSLAGHQWPLLKKSIFSKQSSNISRRDNEMPWILHFLGSARRYHWEVRSVCMDFDPKMAVKLANARDIACSSLDFSKQALHQRLYELVCFLLQQ